VNIYDTGSVVVQGVGTEPVKRVRSTVSANGTGVNQDTGGSALSYGTNSVDGNGTNGTFGTVAQQ
jgi:hypothetical protein